MGWTAAPVSILFRERVGNGYPEHMCQQRSASFRFCNRFSIAPLLASEENLCVFASFLSAGGLSHKTIECYLSAVCNLHLECDRPGIGWMVRLRQIIKETKSQEVEKERVERLHIQDFPLLLTFCPSCMATGRIIHPFLYYGQQLA